MKPRHITRVVMAALAAAVLTAPCMPATAGKLYKWVDDHGEVHYGDSIPPKYAGDQRQVLSDQGVVVKTIDRAKTPAELAAEAAAAKRKAEAEQQARIQAAHDRMLLATFSSTDDMVMARDGKIAALDAMIRVTRDRITTVRQQLQAMTAEAAAQERAGRPVSKGLNERIAAARAQIQSNESYIAARQKEQQQIRTQFEADIKRFKELKTEQAEALKEDAAAQQQPAPAPTQ